MIVHGIFVGINEYRDSRIENLCYARPDAEKLHQLFKTRFRHNAAHLLLVTDKDATKDRLFRAIGEELSRSATVNDLVFLYFACHGSPETSGSVDKVSRYLATYDTDYTNIFATAIDLNQELRRLIARIKSKSVYLFLDACFSGKAGGRTLEGPILMNIRNASRSNIPLKNIDLGQGRLIITAADDSQVAYESELLGHGVFTYFLIDIITNTLYGSSTISITTLYDHISRKVREYTQGKQTPILNGRSRHAQLPMLTTIS